MARGAAISDASAQNHDEAAGECHRRASGKGVEAHGPFPDRRNDPTVRSRRFHRSGAATIVFNPNGLISALGFETDQNPSTNSDAPRLMIPMALRRRGVETKLVLTQDGHAHPEPDRTLIRALARARRWMAELIDGEHPSVEALAKAYHTDKGYVARHLPLACLSPSTPGAAAGH